MKPITIITFNAGLLDINLFGLSFFKPVAYIEKRTEAIAGQLKRSNADIIALQEVYLRKHHQYFIQELERVYPFHAYSEMPRFNWGSGLMTFSKYPITDWNFTPFKERGTIDEKIFAKRGILNSIVKISRNISVNVVNIHLTSGGVFYQMDSIKVEQKRSQQIREILNILKNTEETNAITLGDFNSGPMVSSKNYTEVRNYGFTDVYYKFCQSIQIRCKNTWDTNNPLNTNQSGIKSNRIDHIMMNKDDWKILNSRVIFKDILVSVSNKKPKMATLSDHYGLEATLELSE